MVLVLPLLIVVGPFLLWPVVFGFVASFTDYSPFMTHPRLLGFANYAALFSDRYFIGSFRTAATFSAAAIAAELALGLIVAWLLREPFRGRGTIRVILLLPWLVSPVANGVMWHFLFEASAGIPNFFLAIVGLPILPSPLGLKRMALPAVLIAEVWRTAPLVTFLLLPGFSMIPRQLWEHATMEGLTDLGRFFHIVLPSLRPLLLTIAMLLIGSAFGTFDGILILTHGGPGTETLTPALYSYQKAFQANNWPLGAASAWFIAAAVLIAGGVYVFLTRREASRS